MRSVILVALLCLVSCKATVNPPTLPPAPVPTTSLIFVNTGTTFDLLVSGIVGALVDRVLEIHDTADDEWLRYNQPADQLSAGLDVYRVVGDWIVVVRAVSLKRVSIADPWQEVARQTYLDVSNYFPSTLTAGQSGTQSQTGLRYEWHDNLGNQAMGSFDYATSWTFDGRIITLHEEYTDNNGDPGGHSDNTLYWDALGWEGLLNHTTPLIACRHRCVVP